MRTANNRKPAALETRTGSKVLNVAVKNVDDNESLLDRQARLLCDRYHMSWPHARRTAELAFATGV